MSEKPIICVGDTTSNGGSVVTGSPTSSIDGRFIARLGDTVSCRKCGRRKCVISSASSNHVVDGLQVARDGDLVSCGVILMAIRVDDTT